MFINLKNKTFQIDPDIRFSRIYGVPTGVLNELCGIQNEFFISQKRATMIVDYFNLKYTRKIPVDTFLKWRKRRQIYLMTETLRRKNTKSVPIEWFGELAEFVKDQLG